MFIPKKYLTEKILIESKLIMADDIFKLLLQDKNAKVGMAATSDPNFSYYKKLAEAAASGRVQGRHGAKSRIELDKIKLSKRTEVLSLGLTDHFDSLSNALNALQTLMESKGHYDPNNEASNIIQITTLEILAAVLNLKPPVPPKPDPEIDPSLKAGIDWTAEKANRLKNPNGKTTSKILDEFYNDYYKIEYAGLKSPKDNDSRGIVAKLESLNKILIPEFNKLGYNPDVNPLAQFLKILIKEKPDIFNKLTTNTYGAIHNSFIDKSVTGNMLGNYNKNHLLFCDDLYNHSGLEIVEYLSVFKNTLDMAKEKAADLAQDAELLAAKIVIQQDLTADNGAEEEEQNTFAAKVKQLVKKQENIKVPADSDAKLRSFLEINDLYKSIFGEAPTKKVVSKKNKVIEDILQKVKDKNAILDMIYYIANSESALKNKDSKEVMGHLSDIKYTKNTELVNYCRQVMAPYIEELPAGDLRTLIEKLFSAYSDSQKKAGK